MRRPDEGAGYTSESGDSVLDMSIVGDEEEEARIRLESNLQDLSIQLSGTNPSYTSDHEGGRAHKSMVKAAGAGLGDNNDDTSSDVEYPRHDPRPHESSIFQGYNSPLHVDNDYDPNYYSYRTTDDDDMHHFAADTMSTAAHHTSALSLNAGLTARGGRRAFDNSSDWTPRPKHFSRKADLTMQPPTPTSMGSPPSKFSKIAQDLAKDIEAGERLASSIAQTERARRKKPRKPTAHDTTIRSEVSNVQPATRRSNHQSGNNEPRSRNNNNDARARSIHLPDVTGLTSAIGSPTKSQQDWRKYEGKGNSEAMDTLLRNLSKLQTRLNELENQNLVSRRRVRELELELEACKAEVKRERTRVMEREEIIVAQQREVDKSRAKNKGNGLNAPAAALSATETERLRQVTEEKKALEALVTSLRSHLARLTAELASQQELLQELQSLRETDLRAINEKMGEVDKLRRQVERLGGEVEVLRGVVEAGLNERRKFRDGLSFSGETENDQSREKDNGVNTGRLRLEELQKGAESNTGTKATNAKPQTQMRSALKSRNNATAADKQKETRRAMVISPHATSTVDSSQQSELQNHRQQEPLIDFDESDFTGRRGSNSPNTSFSRNLSAPRRSLLSPEPQSESEHERSRILLGGRVASTSRAAVDSSDDETEKVGRDADDDEEDLFRPPSRPGGPTPRRASALRTSSPRRVQGTPHPAKARKEKEREREREKERERGERENARERDVHHHHHDADTSVPFPQIRGERLERLFFSAPDHDAAKCGVCRRRRGKGVGRRRRSSGTSEEVEDEGFDEGDGDDEFDVALHGHRHVNGHRRTSAPVRGKDRNRWEKVGPGGVGFGEDKTSPQTVVVRVLRELEDDFTHYKGIYIELAEQYKIMDAMSNVPKRNVLAEHLKEVIDVLEQKGDQIAALYECLEFKDKPVAESIVYGRSSATRT